MAAKITIKQTVGITIKSAIIATTLVTKLRCASKQPATSQKDQQPVILVNRIGRRHEVNINCKKPPVSRVTLQTILLKHCGESLTARHATLSVMGQQLKMELDTGSAYTVISEYTWHSIGSPALNPAPTLTAYGGFPLSVLGQAEVTVQFHGEVKHLQLVVVRNRSTSLLGP